MAWIAFAGGLVLLALLIADVHVTVFVPRGGAGPVSRRVYRAGWVLWRRLTDHGDKATRRRRLAWFGPVLVPGTIVIWGLMLIVGFALLYAPWVSSFSISPSESGPMRGWAIVLYYSGYSAVTLGVGDVVAAGTFLRLLAVLQAAFGFALFTVSITYLLSVYNARNQSTSVALMISRLVGSHEGMAPADLVAGSVHAEALDDLTDWLETVGGGLASLAEMVGQYPLIQYFHEPSDDRAIPVALSELLEVTALCRSMLDPERFPRLADGPGVRTAERLAVTFLEEGQGGVGSDDIDGEAFEGYRRDRFERLYARLGEEGIPLRPEAEAWERFERQVRRWDTADEAMRAQLGYQSSRPSSGAPQR